MTDAEKKMKKYIRSVERKLNLSKDVKSRVMSDFRSSVQARRESGMTDEEIYAELGTPKKAAADLNEQMKEYAYRKSPWRFAFLAMAAYGAAEVLAGLWANILYWALRLQAMLTPNEAVSIGIIGGADGPTAIFVTRPIWMHYITPVILLIIGCWGFLRLRRCKRK